MCRTSRLCRMLAVIVAVGIAVPLLAQAQTRGFELAEQDAITGIPAFARQAGVQVLVAESAVRGQRTAAVSGTLPIRTALRQLLAGTGLSVLSDDGVTITLGAQPHAQSDILEEVIVTALRRAQGVQEAPVAVAVLPRRTLLAKGAQDFRDYLTSIPGVSYTEGGLRAVRVVIRGVSDGIGVTDPLTGIYLDEMPITESFQATLDPNIYDVERVEVLKGPQGTLYGSGSMGGTVRVITTKPQLDVFDGAMEGTLGGVDDGGVNRRVDGVVNVPLRNERSALRVSGGYRKDGGWIDNVQRGEADANTVEKVNGRGQLLLKPGEDTSLIFGVLYQGEDLGSPFFDDLALPDNQTARAYRQGGSSQARLYSATIQHDFDWMTALSASNYLSKNTITTTDSTRAMTMLLPEVAGVTLGPGEGTGVESRNALDLFTQEVRLSSIGKNRLDWVAGGFYSNAITDFATRFDFSQAPSTQGVISGDAFYRADEEYRVRQGAVFGELTWNLTAQLALTAGLRAFDVQQRNTLVGSGKLNDDATTTRLQEASTSSATAKFLAKYQVTRDHMIYAQAAQGYRNGGATGEFSLAGCAADLAAAGYSTVPSKYDPDKLWNYEIGTKNTLLEGRMTVNAAGFYIDWRNIQAPIGLDCGFAFVVNAGKAVSKGAEADVTIRPLSGLTLTAGASYIDARLEQAAPGTSARAGDPLPLNSEWAWNVTAQYERTLFGRLQGFVLGEVNHAGDRWNTFRSTPARAHLLGDYTTLNLRIGVSGERWSAALFGTNLTNEHVVIGNPGTIYEIVASPRVVGLTLSINQ